MGSYIIRRLLYMVPIWLGISLVAFSLTTLTPGDPARLALQRDLGRQPTAEEVEVAREQMGLNAPFVVRYVDWVVNAARGDLGTSFRTGEPVLNGLASRFPKTLEIATLGLLFSLVISVPLGAFAALHRNAPIDHFSRILALIAASMPSYWLAYLLILLFSVRFGWLPVAGTGTWQHYILPSVSLGLVACASLMRLTRSEMLEVMGQDYVRTARAKGLSTRGVVFRHALRNAMIPVTTLAGLRFAGLLGGAVIVETIFAWPGIGRFVLESIFDRDYPVIQGFVVFMGTVFLLMNLLVDISYAWLDPRIRLANR